MFKVVRAFADAQDHEHVYNVGDTYPREGVKVSKNRLEELSSRRNRCGVALIVEETPEEASPLPEKGLEEDKTGVNPPQAPKAKRKPRKG